MHIAAVIFSKAVDVVTERGMEGIHHQIGELAFGAFHWQGVPVALLAVNDVIFDDFVSCQGSPLVVADFRLDKVFE